VLGIPHPQWMWSRGWTSRFWSSKTKWADFNDSFSNKTEAYPRAIGYPKLLTFPTQSHHIQSNRFQPSRGIELPLAGI
jgi:hypothetical protein